MRFLDKLFNKDKIVTRNEQLNTTNANTTNIPLQVQVNFVPNKQPIQIPELQGEYAKAVFLNAYQKTSRIKNDSQYQRYLIYECGIKEPSKYHLKMVEEDYLEQSNPIEMLKSLKVDELKAILGELGQKKVGKKEELIQRIVNSMDINSIAQKFPQKMYCISSKGKQFLEQHTDYVKIHEHVNWRIDWKEYDKSKKQGYSFYDVVWGIFNKRIGYSNNFGRNEYFNMYQLLDEEGRKKDALEKLLMVLYNDVSGIQGLNCYQLYKSGTYNRKQIIDCFDIAIMVAPGILEKIKDNKDVYSDDIVNRIFNIYKLPVQICSKKLFLKIIHSIIDDDFSIEQIVEELRTRYIAYIKSL